MGWLIGGIVQSIVELFMFLVGARVRGRLYASSDRRKVAEGRTRMAVRAREGRVLNIGTEWSDGVAEISPGRLHFVPRLGIVGDRDIEVVGLTPTPAPVGTELPNVGLYSYFDAKTPRGDLFVALPETQADRIVQLLGATVPTESGA